MTNENNSKKELDEIEKYIKQGYNKHVAMALALGQKKPKNDDRDREEKA